MEEFLIPSLPKLEMNVNNIENMYDTSGCIFDMHKLFPMMNSELVSGKESDWAILENHLQFLRMHS